MSTIAALKLGQTGIISEQSEHVIPLKLLEMGCLPGTMVELVQKAPFNDPLYINVNGSHMAIRRDIAEKIKVTNL
ncbi:FeoA family protein [uncultured Tenacibaculum sp.]|uniref:FeoA family protein n=1 Tax=uncultured Tenacibaculum sp. TaxID=174713 RepID=UPI002613BB9B|nr:FeoA family protein [uncultured Tenacibaculum sp.]